MQRLNNQSATGTRTVSRFQQVALATLWLIIAMMIVAPPSRGESMSLNGQIATSRVVGQISSALFTYASRVESLAQDHERASWTQADVTAGAAYRRLVWYVSALQMSATTAEIQEFAEIQEMIDVYREMHDRITASAKAGDRSGVTRTAKTAAAVVDQIHGALQRIENRGYNELHDAASRLAALN
jgi:hypothetical protein